MNWNTIETESDLEKLIEESHTQPILLFKHSTRCSISATALGRIERNWTSDNYKLIKPYFLDLITYRNISNEIADKFKVLHESPQVLLIKNGVSVYNNSHMGISLPAILENL